MFEMVFGRKWISIAGVFRKKPAPGKMGSSRKNPMKIVIFMLKKSEKDPCLKYILNNYSH